MLILGAVCGIETYVLIWSGAGMVAMGVIGIVGAIQEYRMWKSKKMDNNVNEKNV